MNAYENLISECGDNITVIEKDFKSKAKGLCKGNKIGISKAIETSTEKRCVLAEELGHYHTTVGNILDQSDTGNRKQERIARFWAYKRLIGLSDLIRAFRHGDRSIHEIAEFLEISEDFLRECLETYRQKYGTGVKCGEYFISFEPWLSVFVSTDP